jgi:hypothetical protein
LADKTRNERENNRAYPGHEPSEAHTTAVPVDLGAPSDLIGAHEPMSIEAVLAAPIRRFYVQAPHEGCHTP